MIKRIREDANLRRFPFGSVDFLQVQLLLLATIRSLHGMEICGLWSSPKWALADNFARHVFHSSLLREIKEVSLLSQSESSACVDMYQADIYPVLLYPAILRVISLSCLGFFSLLQLLGNTIIYNTDICSRSFEYGFICELTLEAQKSVTEKWRGKKNHSIFLFCLYSDI